MPNRGGVTIRDVTHTAAAMEQLVNAFPRKRIQAKIKEPCFLCGPCREVIKGQGRSFGSVEFRNASLPGYELRK
jgi:hypothetical protein